MPPETIGNSTWLVATKLRPPVVRDDIIRRPKLEKAMADSVRNLPLTLLSAPAGYGKTTMLALLSSLVPEQPLAWVTLDSEDNDPVRFVSLLAAALQGVHQEWGRSLPSMLMGGGADPSVLKRAIGELINDVLQFAKPLTLVLDDLHLVTEPAAYVVLEYLLSHLPPQMHLAVGTRHDPPLRLARLAARRQVLELRRPDLGFSEGEAQELLVKGLGIELSNADVAALQERTEGWPAGLCLLSGPLARLGSTSDRTEFMAALSHNERYALDFLAEEVLRDLPADVRRFLLQTSVLSEMTPSACAALTGRSDAADMLDRLYRWNLTIASLSSADGGEPVYRHHALFARLLARQLEREMPDEIPDLHRRAARLQSTPGRAIGHYLSAGDWDEAAQLMVQASAAILARGMYDTISSWYAMLPTEAQDANPRLKIVVARAQIHRGDYAAARTLLEEARQAFLVSGEASGEGDALTSQITMSYQDGDRACAASLIDQAIQLPLEPLGQMAVRLGRAWLRLAECDWHSCRNYITEALAIPKTTSDRRVDFIGMTYMSAPLASVPGCLAVTEKYCAEAAERAVPGTAWRLGADELGAWPLLWRGRVDEALTQAEAADALRRQLGGYPFMGSDTSVILAVLYLARGEREAALQATDTLLQRLEHASIGKRDFYLHAAGRSRALFGDLPAAHALHRRLTDMRDSGPLAQYMTDHLAGLIALTERRFGEASDALGRAAALEINLPVARVGGSARLLQAMLLFERGDRGAAVDLVDRVLGEWLQEGTPGYVLLDGPAILPVLTSAAERGVASSTRVLGFFRQPVAPGPALAKANASLPEPLTQREIEVLRLIAAGRTNRQIGEELYIGEETVKSHVVHILRKLDVTSRTQAAVRARELGL